MQAIFIGYDIPLAVETKWNNIMPALDKIYKVIQYEGDSVHIINGESDINFVEDLLVAYNTFLDINLTLEIFKVDESLIEV